jgi:hypothetical protein
VGPLFGRVEQAPRNMDAQSRVGAYRFMKFRSIFHQSGKAHARELSWPE